MSILDKIFGGNANTAVPVAAPAGTQLQAGTPVVAPGTAIPAPTKQTLENAATGANGTVPVDGTVVTPTVPDSPLAPFAKLWEDVPKPEGEGGEGGEIPLALDATAIAKVVENADYSAQMTPENLAAIAEGGEAATKAFTDTMTAVAKQNLIQATMIGNKLAENMIEKALAKQAEQIPAMVRDNAVQSHLATTNPAFTNPAIIPVIEAAKQQLLAKNPTATPAEITVMAQDYIVAMGEAFAPVVTKEPDVSQGTDFSTFLEKS